MTEETKVSSFFWKFCPGRFIRSRPGRSMRSLPGRSQFFPILTFKGSLPGISKFYSSWKLRFRLRPSKNFQKCWQLENPFFTKFYSSWEPPPFTGIQSRKRKKIFLKKGLTKIKKYGILKLEKMRKGKCGNGKI